ncbi:NADH-cytochrome b5 reductase [Mortierella claussenii]|nr:NADH-cytochrome b5 reductase [Mortierella claussenii]
MLRLINPLKATVRAIPRQSYSTSAKPSGGSSKLLTVGLPLAVGAAGAYAYFGDKLGGTNTATPKAAEAAAAAPKDEPVSSALNPNAFVDFKLKNVQKLTHNTSLFSFELEEGQKLGLDITSCVLAKFAKEDGKPVIRPYTPTSDADQTGSFEFTIKHYEGNLANGMTRSESYRRLWNCVFKIGA